MINHRSSLKKYFFFFILFFFSITTFSQTSDSTKQFIDFKSAITITNNGFSFIPAFTLDKPAAVFNFSVAGKRFSFDPELRFSLEGKPWGFIFIWRYKIISHPKFNLTIGTHLPSFTFRTLSVVRNDIPQDLIQTQRFVATELMPHYFFTKKLGLGIYYIYGRGIEPDAPQNAHFISLRSHFLNVPIFKQVFLNFTPQFFYLNLDAKDGYYVAANLGLEIKNFPLSLSTMLNKVLKTDIAGKDFNWNINLVYAFNKTFVRQ